MFYDDHIYIDFIDSEMFAYLVMAYLTYFTHLLLTVIFFTERMNINPSSP